MTDKPPLIESLRRYGSDFISHAASRGIEDIEAAGELMLAAARVLAEQPAEQEPVALLHDDGYWTAAKTDAGRRLSERLLFAGSPSIAVYTAPQPAIPPGYKLVPEVPTNEWINNLAKTQTGPLEDVPFADIYRCIAELLDTAPEAPKAHH